MLQIDEAHRPFLAAAILRFIVLHAGTNVDLSDQIVHVDDGSQTLEGLVQDFHHCLYREKIYAETLPPLKFTPMASDYLFTDDASGYFRADDAFLTRYLTGNFTAAEEAFLHRNGACVC